MSTWANVPDQPVNPLELSDEEYERNCRNSDRDNAIISLGRAVFYLDELNHDGPHRTTQELLEELIAYLWREMEV